MNQTKHINQVSHILTEIRRIILDFGFVPKIISNDYQDEINYVYKNLYCIPQYVENLGFLIEYANSFEEAKNHCHEDGDIFPLYLGEKKILLEIKKEISIELEALDVS